MVGVSFQVIPIIWISNFTMQYPPSLIYPASPSLRTTLHRLTPPPLQSPSTLSSAFCHRQMYYD